jgi:hypothetical protein
MQHNMLAPSASSASTTAESDDSITKNRAPANIADTINESTTNSLHQNTIAHKMRGIGKKMSRFRSRSAERVSQQRRNCTEPQEATEYDASNLDPALLHYPSRENDKTHGVITFR